MSEQTKHSYYERFMRFIHMWVKPVKLVKPLRQEIVFYLSNDMKQYVSILDSRNEEVVSYYRKIQDEAASFTHVPTLKIINTSEKFMYINTSHIIAAWYIETE